MQLASRLEGQAGVRRLSAQLAAWLKAPRLAEGSAKRECARWLRAWSFLRRKVAGRDSQVTAWTETLGRVIADLDLLNHDTERDFLRIGEKLATFIEAVSGISSAVRDLTNLISVEHGQLASQALTGAIVSWG